MEKLNVGTKVTVSLSSTDAHKLGITQEYYGPATISGVYPLGHYIKTEGGRILAIADKYNAVMEILRSK